MTMKFLVLVLCLGAVFARPDVSHLGVGYQYKPPTGAGYQYQPPTTSYGVPVDNGHGESAHHHHHVSGVPSGSYLPGGLQVPLADKQVHFFTGNNGQDQYGFNSHLIQDQKHVYYYAAPDEEEHTHLRIHLTPNNQKNTNVIFVKAPNSAPVIPEVIAPQSQAEEKTKVFVLVKKPEQPAAINIHAPAPVTTKPEVYVVKYKNQHEAEQVISGGRGGHPLGVNANPVGDEHSFIKVLESDSSVHVPQNDKYSGFDGNVNVFGVRTSDTYGVPQVGYSSSGSGSGGSLGLRGSFGSGDAVEGSSILGSTTGDSHGSGSVEFSSVNSDSGKGSSFDFSSSGSGISGSGSTGGGSVKFSSVHSDSGKGSNFEFGSSGSGLSSGSGSVGFPSLNRDSGKESSFEFSSSGSGLSGGSSTASNSGNSFGVQSNFGNGASVEGSSLLGSTTGGKTGSGGVEIAVVGIDSGKGSGLSSSGSSGGSHISSSLDSLNVGGNSGKTEYSFSSSSSNDNSKESSSGGTLGLRGNFVGGDAVEGSSLSSTGGYSSSSDGFSSSSDASKSGSQGSGLFSGTIEINSSGDKVGKQFTTPLLASLTGGSQGGGSSSSSYEFSSSKSGNSFGSVGGHHGDSGDAGSGTSLSGYSVKSVHTTYGAPGVSGPY